MQAAGSTVENYTPKACPLGDDALFWRDLRDKEKELTDQWLESDLYEHSKSAVDKLVTEGDATALRSLHHTSISGKLSPP